MGHWGNMKVNSNRDQDADGLTVYIPFKFTQENGFAWRIAKVRNSRGVPERDIYYLYVDLNQKMAKGRIPRCTKPYIILNSLNAVRGFAASCAEQQDPKYLGAAIDYETALVAAILME
jgi:hypothetical protein